MPPEARDPNAVKLLTLWPAPNVPGTNRYRTTITNKLDTRQEFVRADYNINANWSLTGRYLHDRLDSRGEYLTGPDLTPGIATRSAISLWWKLGGREDGCCTNCRISCRTTSCCGRTTSTQGTTSGF